MKSYAGCVYVMDAPDGAVKVGFSNDPSRRLKELRDGGSVNVLHTTRDYDNAFRVERAAHRLLDLAGRRIKGELFQATLEEAIAAIERAERIVAGSEPLPPLPTVARSQFILRVAEAQVERIEALRRNRSPIPNVSDLLRALIDEAYEREVGKGRGRK